MAYRCKGSCELVQYPGGQRYTSKSVRCYTCDRFLSLEGIYKTEFGQVRCKCCHNRVRVKRRYCGKVKLTQQTNGGVICYKLDLKEN